MQAVPEDFDRRDRITWAVLALGSAIVIWLADDSLALASFWLALSLGVGQLVWPALMRCARAISGGRECFLRDVIFGWALVPGPLVGIAFGVLTPAVFQWPILCFWGGVLGLFVGPVVAAIEGVLVAGFVRIGYRLVTGSRFA